VTLPDPLLWVSVSLALACCSVYGHGRGGSVTGRLVGARSTGESAPAAIISVAFRNDSADAVDIQSYRLRWPGGTFSAKPHDLRVPPHTEIERTARVDAGNGDIAELLDCLQQAAIEIIRAR
jgi:hypothetical protein